MSDPVRISFTSADGEVWLRVRHDAEGVRLFVATDAQEIDVVLPREVADELGNALAGSSGSAGSATPAGAPSRDGTPDSIDAAVVLGSVPTDPDDQSAEARPRSLPPEPTCPPPDGLPWDDVPDEPAGNAARQQALGRLRRLNDVLPETAEIDALGSPTFRVSTRMYATVELHDAMPVVRFRTSPEAQAALLDDERFRADPDTGQHGWTNLRADRLGDDEQFEDLMVASYRLVAPGDVISQLDDLLRQAGGSSTWN